MIAGKVLPPDTWTTKENVVWKVEIPGHGWSCPIVVGGKVFVTSCVSDDKVVAPKTGYYAPKDTKTLKGEHRWTLYCLDVATEISILCICDMAVSEMLQCDKPIEERANPSRVLIADQPLRAPWVAEWIVHLGEPI